MPGTTRDAISEACELSGETVTLLDTAGLRSTDDEVEKIGVAVAERAGGSADLVVYVVDALRGISVEDEDFLRRGRGEGMLLVMTKADLVPQGPRPVFPFKENLSSSPSSSSPELLVSAVTGTGIDALRSAIASRLGLVEADGDLLVLERHRESLSSAGSTLREAAALGRDAGGAPELVAARVREALSALGTITGETATEELLDRIFATFCVGK